MRDDFLQIEEASPIRRGWDTGQTMAHIRQLPVWAGPIELRQLFGGLQNRTYFITDGDGARYVARSGFDQGRIRQTSVVACTLAAARLGIGPALRYAEPGLTITDFVHGPQVRHEQQRDPAVLARIIDVLKVMHGGSEALTGPVSYWAPFHTVRRYLDDLEKGFAATGHTPSPWAAEVPFFRSVTHRLERAIGPCNPVFTHNDLGFANIMFRTPREEALWLIDWDGGGYGNPLWDLAEMAMWANADEALDRFLLSCYFGQLSEAPLRDRLHEHVAFKIMAALRLMTECMQAAVDPYYYLSPEEVRESMRANFADQQTTLAGIVDLLRPTFERLWQTHGEQYR
jgi:thiamine kinase-like enzyme